jgi:hypothetical protein
MNIGTINNDPTSYFAFGGTLYRATSVRISKVIHARDIEHYPGAVYIGREHSGRGRGPSFKRSPWANPWKVKDVGRERAVQLYSRWIAGNREAAALLPPGRWHKPTLDEIRDQLRGKTLACWCDHKECHGHLLEAIANGY